MKKWKLVIALGLAAIAIASIAFVIQRRERKKVDVLVFDQIQKNAWNLDEDLVWGYYFIDERKLPLQASAWCLDLVGYRVVSLDFDDEKKKWWLHVEKVGRHTLDSMASLNVRLDWLARACIWSEYDGWDVGPIINSKKEANKRPEPMSVLRTAMAHH